MKNILREHLALLMICFLYMVGSDILSIYIGVQHPEFDYYPLSTILLYILQFYYTASLSLVTFLLVYFIAYSVKNYQTKPFWRQLARTFKNQFLSWQQVAGLILIFMLVPLFFAFITMYKQLIPFVKPFSWDQTLMHWDYVLHFNHHPWQLLQPIIGYPMVSELLGDIYGYWFFVLAGTILWQASSRERVYRMQFFLTYLIVWILLGTFLAFYLSSAGPCFYDTFSHDTVNPYAPLMSYLHLHGPSWVIDLQDSLLIHLINNKLIFGGGVSAMPSMHISMATLCFLIFWKHNKWLGLLAFIFLILTFISSVHLAWHYAVDGYVSILMTLLVWYCVGKMLRRPKSPLLGRFSLGEG